MHEKKYLLVIRKWSRSVSGTPLYHLYCQKYKVLWLPLITSNPFGTSMQKNIAMEYIDYTPFDIRCGSILV